MTDKQNHLWDLVKQAQNVGMDYDLFERLMKARRYAARYHRLCEDYCNGEGMFKPDHSPEYAALSNEEQEARQEVPFKQIESRLGKLFDDWTIINDKPAGPVFSIEHQRDPRGWEIKLRHVPTGVDLSDFLYGRL